MTGRSSSETVSPRKQLPKRLGLRPGNNNDEIASGQTARSGVSSLWSPGLGPLVSRLRTRNRQHGSSYPIRPISNAYTDPQQERVTEGSINNAASRLLTPLGADLPLQPKFV